MAKKYYAVRRGKTPGIYMSWEDCKAQVHGFAGAEYKSFSAIKEAEIFMEGEQGRIAGGSRIQESHQDSPAFQTDRKHAVAYVDGSYNVETKEFAYGVVMFHDGKELHFSEKVEDVTLAEMRNVAGEIKGAECAMRYAALHDCETLRIYHDYEGIAKWCTGAWKANKEGTKAYKAFYDSIRSKVQIEFVKVKGHSGDIYNDKADELAKKPIFH